MNQSTIVGIAYIACSLISGKKITSLYDIDDAKNINVKEILDADFIREFDERHSKGLIRGCMYEYKPSTGHTMEIFIDKGNFIIHIKSSAAYFIGNVQKDIICFYSHKDEMHFKYEIKGWREEGAKYKEPRHAHAPALGANAGLF